METPPLEPGQVHLWHADLDVPASLSSCLSSDEQARAVRMAPTPRRRFERSRTLLREILSGYLDRSAELLRFETRGEGKPVLAGRDAGDPHFNLSHAAGRWLLAVSPLEVGVDVERGDRSVDMENVARRVLRPAEAAAIHGLSGEEKRLAFFRARTGREALVKAQGEGMFTLSLDVEMDLDPGRPLALRGAAAADWTLVEVALPEPWHGALAVRGAPDRVVTLQVAAA